ncbi:MAG: protein-ADP-ribose hydrolase [Oscillospiraceae bacterium]|nr:protein-ADP-ribose hydrolase [Oscillospiraceae bacterium]
MTQTERRCALIRALLDEEPRYRSVPVPQSESEQRLLLRALLNVREPKPASAEMLELQDAYLQEETRRKGITDLKELTPVRKGIYLWQGDITTLRCGAIVNAANSALLGCFHPNHGCIDNAIHTYAGMQLRAECAQIMARQGHEEETGGAKLTRAYNLPCDYILHTVGPIVRGRLTAQAHEQLASCYSSCLSLAAEQSIASVAFCCISTGEFGFPNAPAAETAVKAVEKFLAETGGKTEVIFNVFKDKDLAIYRRLLGAV